MSINLGVSALEAKIEQYLKTIVPIGTVVAFAGTTVPEGWLLCGGSPVSIAAYPELSAAIGTAHGNGTQNADGSASGFSGTHFNLPDYRGRFLRGTANGSANDPDRALRTASKTGGNAGDAVGSVQTDANVSHTHLMTSSRASKTVYPGGVAEDHAYDHDSTTTVAGGGNRRVQETFTNTTNQNSGGTEARPKNANVNYIIRAV